MALRRKISFTAEGVDRVDAGGAPARVNGSENREGKGHDDERPHEILTPFGLREGREGALR